MLRSYTSNGFRINRYSQMFKLREKYFGVIDDLEQNTQHKYYIMKQRERDRK